ncbi:serine/threonine protein kinase [Actinoplanes subglobosus]|uniref:Serine/threonine protein kinase n=1 Tax=Actinoplanes subglobosus TaxID=1547892 RepID=A0ABV8J820_9ACTN
MNMPLRPGDPVALGRYELVGRLGEGGMGTVFLGRDPDGRPVAIKMVRPEFANEAEFRGRFRSEVTRAKQVPPFSTAEVLDADPDHEPPYLVVEYVDGPSLAAEIKAKGPLAGSALHGVAVGIATALTAIHGAGVIHRDLKPGNVLFARGGIKVIDFGIARAFEATSQHTRTDQLVGTVAYMAPERFDPVDGRPVTAAADIFAWGAVVAYAATGRTPFAADSAPATAMRILTQPPDVSGLPESLRGPVVRALSKEPGDRPTARELLDILLAGGTVTPPAADTVFLPTIEPGQRSAAGPSPQSPAVPSQPPTGHSSISATPSQPPTGYSPQSTRPSQPSAAYSPHSQPSQPPAGYSPHNLASQLSAGYSPGSAAPSFAASPAPGGASAPLADTAVGRPRSRRVLAIAATAAAVVLATTVGVLIRHNGLSDPDQSASGPGEGPASASAPGSAPASASAKPVRTPSAEERLKSIKLGKNRTLIHIAELDRDLALQGPFTEVEAGDGTGPKSEFVLIPMGVDYLIRSLYDPAGEEVCIGVRLIADASAKLVATECATGKGTLFELVPTDEKDDKNRPRFHIYNDAYGFVQWDEDANEGAGNFFVEHVGDAPPLTTFSFVDRGPLPSPSPS